MKTKKDGTYNDPRTSIMNAHQRALAMAEQLKKKKKSMMDSYARSNRVADARGPVGQYREKLKKEGRTDMLPGGGKKKKNPLGRTV